MSNMTDADIVKAVQQGVRVLKAGAVGHGERMKLDGMWVVISVDRSVSQQDGPPFFPEPKVGGGS